MDELSPILIKIEHKSRYGDEKEIKDADALFHEYLRHRADDMKKDLDGETVYSLAERLINFEAADEKQQKQLQYDSTALSITNDYDTKVKKITDEYNNTETSAAEELQKAEDEMNAPMTKVNAARAVGQRVALIFLTYFGSIEILTHAAKEYVDAAIAITAAAYTGYEAYDSSKKTKERAKAKTKKEKAEQAAMEKKETAEQAALAERDLKLARASTWIKTSNRYAYQFADLRRERIYKICEKGADGFPKQPPVDRDDEMRSTFGLWLPPITEYINMDIDASEEIKRKAEKLQEEVEGAGAC